MPRKRGLDRPRSIALYRDIEALLDTAIRLDQWPALVELASPRAATRWAFRANLFRSIMREQEEARLNLPSGTGSSQYDHLGFRVVGSDVDIRPRVVEATLRVNGQVVAEIAADSEGGETSVGGETGGRLGEDDDDQLID